jgi:hypothetical protein
LTARPAPLTVAADSEPVSTHGQLNQTEVRTQLLVRLSALHFGREVRAETLQHSNRYGPVRRRVDEAMRIADENWDRPIRVGDGLTITRTASSWIIGMEPDWDETARL